MRAGSKLWRIGTERTDKVDTNFVSPSSKPVAVLTTTLDCLKGIGPKRHAEFKKSGLRTVGDLLFYFPFRYEDRRSLRRIRSLAAGETVLVQGTVIHTEVRRTKRRRFAIFHAVVEDESGRLQAAWFNQPYLANTIREDYEIALYGEVVESGFGGGVLEMQNPHFEVGPGAGAERGIVPIYERIGSTGGAVIRKIIRGILDNYKIRLPAATPEAILQRLGYISPSEAVRRVHRPPDASDIEALNAGRSLEQQSLVFDEFFFLQAGLALRRKKYREEPTGIAFNTSEDIRATLKGMLPFRLTEGQKIAFKDIVDDMTSPRPMARLLQGDVGCGKTIVALLAAALAMENGCQVALMAPTEVLAEQHMTTVRKHLAHTNYRIRLLTGRMPTAQGNEIRRDIAGGEADLVIGTHTLIQESVDFHKLGLAIIDEQHRFGVLQRARLVKTEPCPDLLILTATPIPRTLTLTLFGDLSVSVIRDMPPGRQPIVTAARTEKGRAKIDAFLETQMREGRQIYSVAPAIEESRGGEARTVKEMHRRLEKTFPHRRIGLLHGRMPSADREAAMADFASGDIDILASTTVIEVGVDVPNATVMLIENSERFGLSQLHQLRGRVGRGEHKSYCILIYQHVRGEQARQRLEIMVRTGDGFEIAEKDLELRGPGDFFGTRQSGMPTLRVGSLLSDAEMLQKARKEAFRLILESGSKEEAEREETIKTIRRDWEKRYSLVLVG